jgi:replication factor C subunit 1
MDPSFLSNKTVCFSGLDIDDVKSILPSSTRILPWSNRADALLKGTTTTGSWKIQAAKAHGIPIVDFRTLKVKEAALWADKYAPKKAKDIIGNTEPISSLYEWLHDWTTEKDRAVLITGPPGIGKTTAAHLVAKLTKYSIVELNASMERSAAALKALFKEASEAGHIGLKRVVIMDEVDGMSRGDRGGIGALASIIKTCTFPIICIANERGTPRLRPLVAVCKEIKFFRPVRSVIARELMKTVVSMEGLKITTADLEELCERNGNDIRQILNFLQFHLTSANGVVSKDKLLRTDVFSATGLLFGFEGDAFTRSEYCWVDHSMVPLMVSEGYLGAAAKGRGSDSDRLTRCSQAADMLGFYDIMDRRIHLRNEWGLLPAALTMVSGAATACKGPAPFQIFPSVLGKMSKRSKHQRMYAELAGLTGSSRANMYDTVNTFRTLLFGLKDAETVCDTLQCLGLTRDVMMDTLTETVFTGDEASVAMDSKLKASVTRAWKKRSSAAPVVSAVEEDAEDLDDDDEDDFIEV